MALAVSSLFVCSLAILAFLSLSYIEREYKQSISNQQYTLVSALAENVDDKLRIAQNSLLAAAANITLEELRDSHKAQRFLDNRYSLLALFDNALFVFSPEGKIVAESPYLEHRRGRDISFRDYFKDTVARGKPVISSPYLSTHNPGHPVSCSPCRFTVTESWLPYSAGVSTSWARIFLRISHTPESVKQVTFTFSITTVQ